MDEKLKEWSKRLAVDWTKHSHSKIPESEFWAKCPCCKEEDASLHVYISRETGEVCMKCRWCFAALPDVERALLKEHPKTVHIPDTEQAEEPAQRDLQQVLEEAAQIIISRAEKATEGLAHAEKETAIRLSGAAMGQLALIVMDHYKAGKTARACGFEGRKDEEDSDSVQALADLQGLRHQEADRAAEAGASLRQV